MNLNVDNNNIHFGALKGNVEKYLFNKLNSEQYCKYNSMAFLQSKNPYDIYVSVVNNKLGMKRLKAQVGDKIYLENFLYGPVSTLRKAVVQANKLLAESKLTK